MKTWIPVAASLMVAGTALASSHREAPNILNDPAADITDVYSFKSPIHPNNQVIIMNVSPGYLPVAGPNWYMFDPTVLYEINIDFTGDGIEDVTYQFQFQNKSPSYKDPTNGVADILSYSGAPVTYDATNHIFSGALSQTYTVKKVTGGRRSGNSSNLGAGGNFSFPVAPPRVGPFVTDGGNANIGNDAARYTAYKTLANNAIVAADNNYVFFAGPRADPFFVDLGGIFDGLNVRLLNAAPNGPKDSLSGTNVLSIVMEVPVSELGNKANFGIWATTSRPQAQVRRITGNDSQVGGGYVQLQRLGNPLVNEVVIGVKDKDRFGYTEPKDDATNYASYVVMPELAYLLNYLYGPQGKTAAILSTIPDGNFKGDGSTSRLDLVDVFVAGVPGFSQIPSATGTGDMLRVNRSLQVGGGYIEGWPLNGRRLDDGVVATALSFLAGCKVLEGMGPGLKDKSVNSANGVDITGIGADGKTFQGNKWSDTHKVAPPTGTSFSASNPANCLLSDGLDYTKKLAVPGGSGQTTGVRPDGSGAAAEFPYLDLPFAAY